MMEENKETGLRGKIFILISITQTGENSPNRNVSKQVAGHFSGRVHPLMLSLDDRRGASRFEEVAGSAFRSETWPSGCPCLSVRRCSEGDT
jgi:hypothetical protein